MRSKYSDSSLLTMLHCKYSVNTRIHNNRLQLYSLMSLEHFKIFFCCEYDDSFFSLLFKYICTDKRKKWMSIYENMIWQYCHHLHLRKSTKITRFPLLCSFYNWFLSVFPSLILLVKHIIYSDRKTGVFLWFTEPAVGSL